MRSLFLLLAGVWLTVRLAAQSPSYAHYGVSEGLPGNIVYCAVEDYRGFIWFGTDKGLARFDGTRFQTFGVKEGLPDPEVLGLFEDHWKRLWISCFSQKLCYMANGKFVTGASDPLLNKLNSGAPNFEFSEDADHNLWFYSRSRNVFVFDGQTVREEIFPETVSRIVDLGDTKFIIGTGTLREMGSPDLYEIERGSFFRFNSTVTLRNQFITAYEKKLIITDWTNGKLVQKNILEREGGSIFVDRGDHFWVPGTLGITKFDNDIYDFSRPVTFLPDKKINAMLEDRHGNLWFCTNGDGVYTCSVDKAATFTRTNGLVQNNITALTRNHKGGIVAGDDRSNLYEIASATVTLLNIKPTGKPGRCRQIIDLPDGNRWIATEKRILYSSRGKVYVRNQENKTLDIGSLKSILVKPGKLWFGTHSVLGYFAEGQRTPIIILKRRTTVLGEDAQGHVWAGGIEGLYSEKDSFRYNWGEQFPALKSRIVAIHNTGPGKLWIVSAESGLLLADVGEGRIKALHTVNDYLKRPIENIQSVFIDLPPGKRIWMSTNTGVYSLNPDNWNVVHYDSKDGLADNDVNCVVVVSDTLWAGTVAGLSCLPLKRPEANKDFRTYVTELRYQKEGSTVAISLIDSLPENRQLLIPPDAAFATLYLTGLDYGSRGKLQYQCIRNSVMPPLRWWTRKDLANWFRTTPDSNLINQNNINFGLSIPNGSFRIKVTALTNQNVYSRQPDEWTIIVVPKWYNTLWFELLLWLTVLYIFWRVYRAGGEYRKLNVAVSQLQLQALQSQINPHFVGNSINAIQQFFYPPNPGGASHYIELFTRLLRRTIFLSEKHFNHFEEELAYDLDYLQMIKLRFGDRFQYEVLGAETIPVNLLFPSMLLQPILENATIHGLAPEGISHLTLRFTFSDTQLRCTVTDNGMGIKAAKMRRTITLKEHTSKGIELLKKKVEAFNDLYDLGLHVEWMDLSESEPSSQGTSVEVAFYPEHIKGISAPRSYFRERRKAL